MCCLKILSNQRNLQNEQHSLEKGCIECFKFSVSTSFEVKVTWEND